MEQRLKIKTGISKAFWCTQDSRFEEASILNKENKSETISWFDKLFEGGILLPGAHINSSGDFISYESNRPLTFLITGPPGSGKSTLALELCYRLTRNKQMNSDGLFTLYISTEADAEQIRENAASLNWEEVTSRILSFKNERPASPAVTIWGTDKITGPQKITEVIATALSFLGKWLIGSDAGAQTLAEWITRIVKFRNTTKEIEDVTPDILVIDSLNIVERSERADFFKKFLEAGFCGTKILIFVLDSGSNDEHAFWSYTSDNVIRLDYGLQADYFVRSIEIVKARFQSHTWGKHQLKIYPPFNLEEERNREKFSKIRRAHPYRKEGGIFIFPSIHKYLSDYKRLAPIEPPKPVQTKIKGINEMLNGGFPEGRCTALIGNRGGHKSHFGYIHLLHRILNSNETGLIISLRDDEGTTEQTLKKILRQEFEKDDFNNDELKRLEVLYYPPGDITPEEFFHRMFMSIHRLKNAGEKLTVLFNSLDQLTARFPLCTKEEIFIPGIIESLTGEGITSIFVAVAEADQPKEQYGLLPMADVILSFDLTRFPFSFYYQHLNAYWRFEQKTKPNQYVEIHNNFKETHHNSVIINVDRFAGGQRAGKGGLLELVDEEKEEDIKLRVLYERPGLHFTPFDERFPLEMFTNKGLDIT